ncbi:C-type lectin domain-containing protein [Podarcis lilfordi]|uniref:C-type lectin domain-containing protein n=1 Tax=Podarcis lilfordi TaxID=74358 RepID=A0AA35JUC0_9SAUR|nr:C-type lectin domain-containing protein [Podarcis lilfordi]
MYDDTGVSSRGEDLQLYGSCRPLPQQPVRKTGIVEDEYEDFDKESDYDSILVPQEMEEPKALPEPPAQCTLTLARWTLTPAQWKGSWRNCLVLLLALVGFLIGIILLVQHAAIFSELGKLNTSCPQESCDVSIIPLTADKLKTAFLKELKALEERNYKRSEATDRKVEEQISKLDGKINALENREICRRTNPLSWHEFLGSCYYYSEDEKQWEDARKFCITISSHLVIINSKREQNFVVTKIKLTSVWIGISDAVNEGAWQWVDGTAPTERFWRQGEPNNNDGVENCAVLYKEGNWNDIDCNLKVHFVCEKPTGCNC